MSPSLEEIRTYKIVIQETVTNFIFLTPKDQPVKPQNLEYMLTMHISKHLEVRQISSAARRIFNSILSVWKCAQTRSFVFDILPQIFKDFLKNIPQIS